MSLTLADVRRLTSDVTRQHYPAIDVLAALPGRDGASYSEVMLMVRDEAAEPYRLVIGVTRDKSEEDFRAGVRKQLQHHLNER